MTVFVLRAMKFELDDASSPSQGVMVVVADVKEPGVGASCAITAEILRAKLST